MHLAHGSHCRKMARGANRQLTQPDYHRCKNFIDQVRAYHRNRHRLHQVLPYRRIQATNKIGSRFRHAAEQRSTQRYSDDRYRKRNNHAANNDFCSRVRNQPARASQPATRPMTIATGANAAAIGSVSNPQSKLVSKPVSILIIGPSSTALISVPMESRK